MRGEGFRFHLKPNPSRALGRTESFESLPVTTSRGERLTISYYPAHDGLPAAWRTKYGVYAVPGEFNETFTSYLPSADGGTSALWYILPGAALGLAVVGGGLGGRRLLTRGRV